MKDETLESLLTNEMKIIFKYLIKIGATKEDAEDIVQDTLCKTIINIDSLDERKIVSWMFKVSINKYYNLYKKNKKLNQYVCVLDDDVLREISTDTLAEEHILSNEYKEYVNKALYELKPAYRNEALKNGGKTHIYDIIAGVDGKLTKDDIKVQGVVVTGDVENLKSLRKLPFIKASSIGVVTDKY